MDEKKIGIAAAGMSVIKYVMAVVIMGFILTQHLIFDKFEETGDKIFITVARGMKVMLIAFMVMSIAGLIQSIIELVILLKGDQETDFGRNFLHISNVIRESAGCVIQFVMGVLFAVMGFFSMFGVEHETDDKGFYIVGGIFAIAGIGCAIGGIISLVKAIRQH